MLNLFGDMMLSALAIDLLYLYYAGAWYDPSRAIEVIEIILLYSLACFGIVRFIWRLIR